MRNAFYKGHGLGNDYVALDPGALDFPLTPRTVRALCDRHRGVGGDGVLALAPSRRADFGVRIFNPDGSEAEKSGNGLRIFARYLHATGRTRRTRLAVETRGGVVRIALRLDRHGEPAHASVEMGRARFRHLEKPLRAAGRNVRATVLSVGNPHCVVFGRRGRRWSREELLALGPALERHRLFPRRTNVQLVAPVGPRTLALRIWERGAGETAASGSSACAAAAAAVRLGLSRSPVSVRAPGGVLTVRVGVDFGLTLDGPVAEVARGRLAPSFVRELSG